MEGLEHQIAQQREAQEKQREEELAREQILQTILSPAAFERRKY